MTQQAVLEPASGEANAARRPAPSTTTTASNLWSTPGIAQIWKKKMSPRQPLGSTRPDTEAVVTVKDPQHTHKSLPQPEGLHRARAAHQARQQRADTVGTSSAERVLPPQQSTNLTEPGPRHQLRGQKLTARAHRCMGQRHRLEHQFHLWLLFTVTIFPFFLLTPYLYTRGRQA